MGNRLNEWKSEIKEHKRLILLAILFLAIASILNYLAGTYVDKKIPVAVSDIILDHIPSIDLGFIFVWGYILIIVVEFLYPLFFKVNKLHIVLSQFSLLVLIRSFFISLTHLGLPADAIIYETPKFFAFLDFKNALFFSGHTAIPFLGFLMFRKEKIGIFFLIATLIMMTTVLFMHVHYSIDVFAALFITYCSFKIGEWIFKKVNNY
jgi:hypothetical protein